MIIKNLEIKVHYVHVHHWEIYEKIVDYYVLKIEIDCEPFSQEIFKIIRLCEDFQKKGITLKYNTKKFVENIVVEIETKEFLDMNEVIKYSENVTYQMMGIESENPAIKFLSLLHLKYF